MTAPVEPFAFRRTCKPMSVADAEALLGMAKTLNKGIDTLVEAVSRLLPAFGSWIDDEEAEPSILGYQSLLTESRSAFEARLLAKTIMPCSLEALEDQKIVREGVALILRVARGRSSKKMQMRLLSMVEDDRFIELLRACLAEQNMNIPPDLYRLQAALIASTRDKAARPQLAALAKSLRPYMPQTRGRRASHKHLAHYMLLCVVSDQPGAHAYTYDYSGEDYTDSRTCATRAAVDDQDFSPTSARRSFRRNRRGATLGSASKP